MHLAFLFLVDIHYNSDDLRGYLVAVIEFRRFYHYPDEVAVDRLYAVFALHEISGTQDTLKVVYVAFLVVLMDVYLIEKAFFHAVVLGAVAELFIEVFGNEHRALFKAYLKNDVVGYLDDCLIALFAFKNVVKQSVKGISYLAKFIRALYVEPCVHIAFFLFLEYPHDLVYRLCEPINKNNCQYGRNNNNNDRNIAYGLSRFIRSLLQACFIRYSKHCPAAGRNG